MIRTAGFVTIALGILLVILGYAGLKAVASVMDDGIGSGTREMRLLPELMREPLPDDRRAHIEEYIALHRSANQQLSDMQGSMIYWSLAVAVLGLLQLVLGILVLRREHRDRLGPNNSLKRTDQSLRD